MSDNWNMIGHQWAISMLKGQIKNNSTRHAYLITGPKGIGKRTLALKMATKLNQPINASDSEQNLYIQQMEKMEHVDLTIVKRKDGDKNIKIDAIRTLQKSIYLSPYLSPNKIVLILNFDEANANAANALLKTLEEPPKSTILFLTATNAEALLPTIVSRCEVIQLRPLSFQDAENGLVKNWDISNEKAKLLAHISGGRIGYALYLHRNADVMAQRDTFLTQHLEMLSAGRVERFQFAHQNSKDRDNLLQMLHVWLSFWRDVMLVSGNETSNIFNLDRVEIINQLANSINVFQANETVSVIENLLSQMRFNINLRLATENLMLAMPSI